MASVGTQVQVAHYYNIKRTFVHRLEFSKVPIGI
jgi:hypothetical protein